MDFDSKVITFTVILTIFTLILCVFFPYFEAKTFNRCTGSNASYMDAVFTQLRATECKK